MAQESPQSTPQSTLLIDLGLPLGDAALNLGIATEYSTDDAFRDPARLDSSLLHALLAKHDSGVSVLAGPSKVSEVPASIASVEKLVAVAREEFDYVIVDLGSRLDLMDTSLFRDAYRIYLVTQAGISELQLKSPHLSLLRRRRSKTRNRGQPL
jgi:pilus assembly protein CpaE